MSSNTHWRLLTILLSGVATNQTTSFLHLAAGTVFMFVNDKVLVLLPTSPQLMLQGNECQFTTKLCDMVPLSATVCPYAGESAAAMQDEEEQTQNHMPRHAPNPAAKPSRMATLRQVSLCSTKFALHMSLRLSWAAQRCFRLLF